MKNLVIVTFASLLLMSGNAYADQLRFSFSFSDNQNSFNLDMVAPQNQYRTHAPWGGAITADECLNRLHGLWSWSTHTCQTSARPRYVQPRHWNNNHRRNDRVRQQRPHGFHGWCATVGGWWKSGLNSCAYAYNVPIKEFARSCRANGGQWDGSTRYCSRR